MKSFPFSFHITPQEKQTRGYDFYPKAQDSPYFYHTSGSCFCSAVGSNNNPVPTVPGVLPSRYRPTEAALDT